MLQLKGYRTVAINVAFFVLLLGSALIGEINDPAVLRGIAIVMAVANVVLRFATTGPVGDPTKGADDGE